MDDHDDHDDHDENDLSAGEPPVIDPYVVLGLVRDDVPSDAQVKAAYRKAALRCHPDKVAPDQRDAAHVQFQEVAFAYAVLSDPKRRARYDATGSTAESIAYGDGDDDDEGFNWSDFYRAAFADAVTPDAIAAFAEQYRHSDEERDDVLVAYARCKGDMDGVYEAVMLSDVLADDARFREMIDAAIAAGDAKAFPKYANETAASRKARRAAATKESREAEAYAKELGVHDKLFGGETKAKAGAKAGAKSGKGSKKKDDDQAGLAALIQKRQQDRSAAFLDNLAAKYGANEQKKKKKKTTTTAKGKKRQAVDEDEDEDEDEPSEEAFQAAAARLKSGKKARR
ncbi:MAG: hypothetical protein STHCBS139747_003719 [Sporothrix thermara]